MKHTYIIFCLSLLLLSLAGCKQDELQSLRQSDTRLTSVKATTSAAVKSRTQLSGNTVIWEQSDAIGIFSNVMAEAVRYDLTEIQGDEARFESETGVSGEEFYAFYPYSAQSAVEGTKVSYRLTDGQDYRAGSFDTGDCPMVAKSTNSDFRFLQTCGIIRLRLTGTMAVSSIRLQGNNGEALAGDGTIDIASDTPVFTIDGSGDKLTAIQLRASAHVQLSESGVTEFYFVVAPQTFTQGITVDITGTVNGMEQTIRKQTQKSITVTRSVISSFAAVDTDAELEPEGPTERDILIALYDATNGDNWTNNTNWCSDKPLSEWYGVSTNSKGRVVWIQLVNNNLVGVLPKEIGNLTELETLSLAGNDLYGYIPEEIGNLINLDYLYLSSNKFEGSIPISIGNLTNLTVLYLENNELTGTIPAEMSKLINLTSFSIAFNHFFGTLSSDLTSTAWWQKWGWIFLGSKEEFDFDIDSYNLYMPNFIGQDQKGNDINSMDLIQNHSLSLFYNFGQSTDESMFRNVSNLYQMYNNHGLGVLGYGGVFLSNASEFIESYKVEWPVIMNEELYNIWSILGYDNTISLFDDKGKLIYYSKLQDYESLLTILKDKLGEGDPMEIYESIDYSADGKVHTLQTATEGNGINVVLMGDGFSDRQIADGTYEDLMRQGMEAFFMFEPFTSFRNFFNLYYVDVVSKNEGLMEGHETALSCYLGEGTHIEGDDDKCMKYAALCDDFTDEELNEILVIVLVNSTEHHGTCYMSGSSKYLGDYGRGSAVAYATLATPKDLNIGTTIHEGAGHGFAKLSDEYYYEENGRIPENRKNQDIQQRSSWGWRTNIDFTNDPSAVYWSKFISDSRYSDEQIGVYEGGRTYAYGVYRPTLESIMSGGSNYQEYDFNAPSRAAIYNRIHKLAYGESWTFDYEEFVNWDLSRSRTVSRAVVAPVSTQIEQTAPPVTYNRRWENGRFVYE